MIIMGPLDTKLVQDVSRRFLIISRPKLEILLMRVMFNTQKQERLEKKCPMPTDLREEVDRGNDPFACTQQ